MRNKALVTLLKNFTGSFAVRVGRNERHQQGECDLLLRFECTQAFLNIEINLLLNVFHEGCPVKVNDLQWSLRGHFTGAGRTLTLTKN